MNVHFDLFEYILNDYLEAKAFTKNKNLIFLRAPEKTYKKHLESFYKNLVHLHLYHVILLHYDNCRNQEEPHNVQNFKTETEILKKIFITTSDSREISLLSFCEDFSKPKFNRDSSEATTHHLLVYISKVIYGLGFLSINFHNQHDFGKAVELISESIKKRLESEKKDTDTDTKRKHLEMSLNNKFSQILPCALYMYLDGLLIFNKDPIAKREIFLYIYEKYVLANFQKCALFNNNNSNNTLLAYVFKNYYSYLRDAMRPYFPSSTSFDTSCIPIGVTKDDLEAAGFDDEEVYTYEDLFNEALNNSKNKKKYINNKLISFSKKYGKLTESFLECICRDDFKNYKIENDAHFSGLAIECIIYLYYSGETDKAREFLINLYEHIIIDDKKRNLFHVFITRCITECKSYPTASALCNLYFNDFSTPRENKVIAVTKKMTNEVNNALKVADETYNENPSNKEIYKFLYEKIFNDEQLCELLKRCNQAVAEETPLKKADFIALRIIHTEFSRKNGYINLNQLKQVLGWNHQKHSELCKENYNDYKTCNMLSVLESFLDSFISKDDMKACNLYYTANNSIITTLIIHELHSHLRTLQFQTLVYENDKLKAEKAALEESETDISPIKRLEIEKKCDLFSQTLLSILGESGTAKYINTLKNSQSDFLKSYSKTEAESMLLIHKKLGDVTGEKFMEHMVTAYKVYDALSSEQTEKYNFDFSPACLPLTKALELVLSKIWGTVKGKIDVNTIDQNDKKYFIINNRLKNSLELGPYSRMFEHKWFKDAVEETGIINFNELSNMKNSFYNDISLPVFKNKNPRDKQIVKFKKNADDNIKIISDAIFYVSQEYRNKVAHKEPFDKLSAEKCREYLISTQHLLWILLYILKDADFRNQA